MPSRIRDSHVLGCACGCRAKLFNVVVLELPERKEVWCRPWCSSAKGRTVEVIERHLSRSDAAAAQIGFNSGAQRSPRSKLWAVIRPSSEGLIAAAA